MACQYFTPCEHGADSFTVMMPKLTFGRGCMVEIGARAAARGFSRVALFVDPHLVESAHLNTVRDRLREQHIDFAIFSEIRIEPDDATVERATVFLKEGNFDGMISMGGGSTMDTAKAAAAYCRYPAAITDYFAPPVGQGRPVPGPVLPHIACPTTSGTGSECTSVSVIRINELDTKFVLGSPHLLPEEALIDPAFTDTLPANVIASTGFDLLCHALECYTARAYTTWDKIAEPGKRPLLQGANPWSDMSARCALEIVGEYLVRGVRDNTDQEARDKLMWGASLAGMAFGNSGTHLPHAMSYGVTHLMENITTDGYPNHSPFIPHGISVVLNAPSIFRYLAEGAPERHFEAAGFLNADHRGGSPAEAGEIVSTRLIELMKDTDMPNGLSGVGLGPDDAPALAASSFRQTRAIHNAPKIASQQDMEYMYLNSISYW